MNKAKRLLCALFAVAVVAALTAVPALAAETDGAGNVYDTVDGTKNISSQGDYIFFSYETTSVQTINGTAQGDIIAATFLLDIKADAGGSIRAAGQQVVISGRAENNITAAGGTVLVEKNSSGKSARGVYLAGDQVEYRGSSDYLKISGKSVYLRGEVTGKVYVNADVVYIYDNFKADEINIESASEPIAVVNKAATGAEDEYFTVKSGLSTLTEKGMNIKFTQREDALTGSIKMLPFSLITSVGFALFMVLVFGKPAEKCAGLLKRKAMRTVGFGLAGGILIPIASVFFVLTVFLSYVGVAALIGYVLLIIASQAFASAALGRTILPGLNRYLSAAIVSSVLTVITAIPSLTFYVFLATALITMGYVISALFKKTDDGIAQDIPPEFQL